MAHRPHLLASLVIPLFAGACGDNIEVPQPDPVPLPGDVA
jgi:hypothetical protein